MTFTVESQPKLSQTVVKTFKRQCIDLVQRSACFANIRTEIIIPFLEHFAREKKWTLDGDAVAIVQAMCRARSTPLCHPEQVPKCDHWNKDARTGKEANIRTK